MEPQINDPGIKRKTADSQTVHNLSSSSSSSLLASGVFDVVVIAGALDAGFVPVSVVREMCHAAKPGDQQTAVTVTELMCL